MTNKLNYYLLSLNPDGSGNAVRPTQSFGRADHWNTESEAEHNEAYDAWMEYLHSLPPFLVSKDYAAKLKENEWFEAEEEYNVKRSDNNWHIVDAKIYEMYSNHARRIVLVEPAPVDDEDGFVPGVADLGEHDPYYESEASAIERFEAEQGGLMDLANPKQPAPVPAAAVEDSGGNYKMGNRQLRAKLLEAAPNFIKNHKGNGNNNLALIWEIAAEYGYNEGRISIASATPQQESKGVDEVERLRKLVILSHKIIVNEQEGEYNHEEYDEWHKIWQQFKTDNNI